MFPEAPAYATVNSPPRSNGGVFGCWRLLLFLSKCWQLGPDKFPLHVDSAKELD